MCNGGGVYCHDGTAPTLQNCVISNNTSHSEGGGICCAWSASPTLVDCTSEDNEAPRYGGGVGLWESTGSPQIVGCRIENNTAWRGGGGMGCMGGRPDVRECTFAGNEALGAAGDGGGAICILGAVVANVANCTICDNSAPTGAGIFVSYGASVLVEKSIIAFNSAGDGITCTENGQADLTCTDVYDNEGGDWVGCLADQWGMEGNIWGDPGFCDAAHGDFSLQASSPCMPDSLLGCGLVGAYGQGCSGDTLVVDPEGHENYPTIQAALDSCHAWDVIELLDGTFAGEGNRDIVFPQKPVTIRSRSGDPSACVISGQDMPPGYHFGMRFAEGNGQEAMVRGVGLLRCHSLSMGGALQCPNGSPRIAGCMITESSANDGGAALYCDSLSAPLVIGCTLSGNHASLGGGVYCGASARPVLQNSIVAFSPEGEAIYCQGDARPVLSCCDLYDNDGGDWKGCISNQHGVRGNFCLDPCFCDAEGGDYTLWNYTPCISEMCGQVGAFGFGCTDLSDASTERHALTLSPGHARPNPFTSTTCIIFDVPQGGGEAMLWIHDLSGCVVRSWDGGSLSPGARTVSWDGTDCKGRPVPAGVHFWRLRVGGQTATRPVLLVR